MLELPFSPSFSVVRKGSCGNFLLLTALLLISALGATYLPKRCALSVDWVIIMHASKLKAVS